SCSPASPPPASTTPTQKPGSPTSSLASPIFPPRVCTNCCPGNGSACAKPICPPISRPPEPLAPHHKPASARAPATIPRPCPCEYGASREPNRGPARDAEQDEADGRAHCAGGHQPIGPEHRLHRGQRESADHRADANRTEQDAVEFRTSRDLVARDERKQRPIRARKQEERDCSDECGPQ